MKLILGQMLIKEGLITAGQLEDGLRNQIIYGYRLGSSLVEMGYLEEDDLARLLSRKMGVPFVGSREMSSVPKEVIQIFSRDLVIRYHVLPYRLERNCLRLAMADPHDFKTIKEIAFITGYEVQPCIAPDVNIARAHARYYPIINGEQLDVQNPVESEECDRSNDEASEAHVQMAEQNNYAPEQLADDLAAACSRDAVADLFIKYIGQEFMAGALFIVRKNIAVGWRGVRDGETIHSFADLSLNLKEPSVLRDVVESKAYSLGAPSSVPQNRQIFKLLAINPNDSLFVVPITIRRQMVALVLVAADMDALSSRQTVLQKLVKKVALAFEMLIIKNKILMA